MVAPMVCVNLFFVPAVALWIHDKRRGTGFVPSVKLLLQYAIFTACNVPLTKIGVFLIKHLLGREIFIDSGYYTLLAIFAAVLLPGLLDKGRDAYRDRVKLYRQGKAYLTKRSMAYKQKLPASFLLVLLIVIAYVIRGPLEIYAGNAHEFLFTLGDFLPWLLVVGAGILVVMGCLLALLPDLGFYLVSALLLWFGVASWIQDLFLNIRLSGENGSPLDWNNLELLPQINLIIWGALLVAIFLLCFFLKTSWFSVSKAIAGALCLIQVIAVASALFILPEQRSPDRLLSGERELQLASEDNVIVLVMDSVGIDNVERMMEEYPEAAEIVKDFTYYDNVCFDYYCTYPSVTHFLTGNEMDFSMTPENWLKESWNSDRCERFYQNLREAGYTCQIYSLASSSNYMYGGIDNLLGKFNNVERVQIKTNLPLLMQKLLSLSAYRCLPYVWKQPFEVLTSEFSDVTAPIKMRTPSYYNTEFYQYLMETELNIAPNVSKLLHVQHLNGLHAPWQTSADATFVESSSETETMRGIFTILQAYFDQMKTLGIYDDATIIVMADHCYGYDGRLSSMFYLKRSGEVHVSTQVNHAPVDYQDIQATILELIGINDGSFGTSFFDWNDGDKRRRVLWEQAVDPDYPPVEKSWYNRNHGYIYYKDAEELRSHKVADGPDYNLPAFAW